MKAPQLNLVTPTGSREPPTIEVPAERIHEPLIATAALPAHEIETGDLEWWSSSPDVVLQEQPRTAIYLNPYGVIVIRQQSTGDGDEDSLVFITRANLRSIIARLKEMEGQ